MLIDATHYINKLKWQLYLLSTYNKYGIWYVTTYILTEKEDSNIVTT